MGMRCASTVGYGTERYEKKNLSWDTHVGWLSYLTDCWLLLLDMCTEHAMLPNHPHMGVLFFSFFFFFRRRRPPRLYTIFLDKQKQLGAPPEAHTKKIHFDIRMCHILVPLGCLTKIFRMNIGRRWEFVGAG